jgi:hypothetical protein
LIAIEQLEPKYLRLYYPNFFSNKLITLAHNNFSTCPVLRSYGFGNNSEEEEEEEEEEET